MNAPESCPVCDGEFGPASDPDYRRCTGCGHELRTGDGGQTLMLNEPLDAAQVRRRSGLDRFQARVAARWFAGATGGTLVDLGCGSGRFLIGQHDRFAAVVGVEITSAAREFCRRELGLVVVADLADVAGPVAAAAAWHSLEHFPVAALGAALDRLAALMPRGAPLIVSVPNAASNQARWFGARWAFFDRTNHVHQFTPASLARTLHDRGFAPTGTAVSWPYNLFGYTQSLLNLAVPGHNRLYLRLKRGAPPAPLADLVSFALLPVALLLAAPLALLDALVPARQGVLTSAFARRA
jgi:hypothetical protein